ncbi:MAG: hypothetical protein FJX93_03540 [Bacteroidetes bacterium]|nr:hypothetical protein [Bacteroidota bacterium]
MSPKDLDKLFRNALGEGQATPRPEAWARVAHGLPQVQRKRRILWWPYAAAVSVALAAVGTWWMTHSRLEVAPSQQLTASNQQLAASNRQPATSNQQLAASNRQPATSNQLPLAASSHGSAAFELAFLPHMEAELGDERVPLLERRIAQAAVEAAPEFALAPEVPRRRYAQLAASVQNVWAAVSEFREAEVPVEVTVEVHVPAVVLQRINQTRTLAENLTESWSTLPSRRSH